MYCGHERLCVCLSAAACPHYRTDPDVTWGMVGMPLVVHYLTDLQSVTGFVAMTISREREMSVSACTSSMPG